ncbi:coiled-coil domain-containing protein 113-like [Bactrocera neohumeralis]|uniref:coiled-coil domain-containing protein 113-like n=1 Tax=Bactrocera neohumeralis TaxID=98809 RepID=UPI0021668BFA|nr:coiled-coil domain-containing protein 113-like [Bactrocera neohumeralis]
MADARGNGVIEGANSVDGCADSAVTLQASYATTNRNMRDAGAALLVDFYTRVYPTVDELGVDLDDLEEGELAEIVGELRTEVDVLKEETTMFEQTVVAQVQSRGTAGNAGGTGKATANSNSNADALFPSGGGAGVEAPLVSSTTAEGRGGRQRPLRPVADKIALLGKEEERLQLQEEQAARQASQVKDLLTATVEESQRRLKELRLEFRQFCREVLKNGWQEDTAGGNMMDAMELADGTISIEGSVCADDLLVYMRRRLQSQNRYLDKLNVQCVAAQEDIARAQQQVRQRKAAGEAFNAVDFAQLKIENDQFNERIETKNAELAELKGTSTRAVQTLNSLVDSLNDLNAEQTQLKKELRSRGEYLMRCAKEVTVVAAEAAGAEQKNQTIKAQHEAVQVPKIEEYIAQTAELFELQKALKNWSRKVEIAEGQVTVLRQQTKTLSRQREAAVAYALEGRRSGKRARVVAARTFRSFITTTRHTR